MTLVVLVAAVVTVALFQVAAWEVDRPLGVFTKEPSELLGERWYLGGQALLGTLIWSIGGAIALFGAALVSARGSRPAAASLVAIGVLTLVLSGDDAFRLHEELLPAHLGVPKAATYAVYAAAFAGWAAAFAGRIARSEWWLLALAFLMLGASVGADLTSGAPHHLLEDGTKFVGIVAWTLYLVRLTHAEVLAAFAPDAGDRREHALGEHRARTLREPWSAAPLS